MFLFQNKWENSPYAYIVKQVHVYSTILRDFPIPLRYPNKKTIRSYIGNLCLWLGALLVTAWFNCRFIETIHWTMIRKPQVHHSVIMLTTYGVLLTSFEKYSILKLQEKKKLMKYLFNLPWAHYKMSSSQSTHCVWGNP